MMPISALNASHSRSKLSIAFTSTVRVLFTTLLFTAGGMGAGLFLGILGTLVYGMISGSKIDMTNAYRHVAIPVAILAGSVALIGSAVLEVRARRQRTSR
jgi:lipopolysaccharide export LptBFGC system permease protein LptF